MTRLTAHLIGACALGFAAFAARPALGQVFFFSTGNPDGLIATLSRPSAPGLAETETADDFVLTSPTRIDSATIVGLLPAGAPVTSATQVEVELYHVFPLDSTFPPDNRVPTRINSPADVEIGSATRNSLGGTLSFTDSIVNPSFTAANSVVNGIHPLPSVFTGGEGAVTGEETVFNITFTDPILLDAGHYFFRPEVALSSGDFLWLSAPKPIVAPGTPFSPDLQTWIRNTDLDPDWLRIGTDITHQGPFNATFSLSGQVVPEPSVGTVPAAILVSLAWLVRRARRRIDKGPLPLN